MSDDNIAKCCYGCSNLLVARQRSGGFTETLYACRVRASLWTVGQAVTQGECPDCLGKPDGPDRREERDDA